MKNNVLSSIKKLKNQRRAKLSIFFKHQGKQFFLQLITYESLSDEHLITLLSTWRKQNEVWFQAQFPISNTRTKAWLEKKVLDVPDRLLFTIHDGKDMLGHIGLFRYKANEQSIDLDNVIRGKAEFPGLMEVSLKRLMKWAKKEFAIKHFTVETTSDNQRALALYAKLGFQEQRRVPLIFQKSKEGGSWVVADTKQKPPIKRYDVFMIQTKKKVSMNTLSPSKKKIAFAGPWITKKEFAYVKDGVKNGFYATYDKHAKKLEAAVCAYTGAKYGIATHCCTLALHLACETIGLKKGDEVICTDYSWVATAYAISYTGARPVFVDIDPTTWCIDPVAVEKAITPKTKAIMLVHTFGHPARMDEIMKIAKKYSLRVIEDAAPALGAKYKNKSVGSIGDIGCFSFQGAKIAVSGEGGMFLTNDKALFEKAKLLSSMGRTDSQAVFWSDSLGFQYTIGNLSASLALAQVERIDELVARKRQYFDWYLEELGNNDQIQLIREQPGCFSNYSYPSLLLPYHTRQQRDAIIEQLKALNIHARPAFPRMSKFPLYAPPRFSNPVATEVEEKGISLPAAGNLTRRDIRFVSKALLQLL